MNIEFERSLQAKNNTTLTIQYNPNNTCKAKMKY